MNKREAEEIINEYGRAIANEKGFFKKQSTLPCSKAKIRYAFYVYIAAVVGDLGYLSEGTGESLVAAYNVLDSFIPDEHVSRLNKISEMVKNKQLNAENSEDKKMIDEYFSFVTGALRNTKYFDEINEYIGECHKEKKEREQ